MKRARLLASGALWALGGSPAGAQSAKVYRVGILSPVTLARDRAGEAAFVRALSGLGYQPGSNLEIIYRGAAGDATRLPELAAEPVRAKPDAIVAAGGEPVMDALKRATTSVPIVMEFAADPVGYGYVASLARPGGNITGVSNIARELTAKELQLLEELVPRPRRIAVIRDPEQRGNMATWRVADSAASKLGIAIVAVDIRSPERVVGLAAAIARQHADGVLALGNPVQNQNVAEFARAIRSLRLPAISQIPAFPANGGLMYYGGTFGTAAWSKAAIYVARILKGAKPAELPVEQPTTFDLVVNLKAAREIGITVPQSILLQATQVIR